MELFVIRHAIAVARDLEDPEPASDEARQLTAEGRARFTQGVRGLGLLGVRLEHVLYSPWLRASQTAELLEPLLDGPARSAPELAAAPSPDLIRALALIDAERVALVGHEPWLSELVAWLVAGDAGFGYAFALKKGGVAHLDGQPVPGAMRLVDFWRPKTLRDLGQRS